MIDNDGHIYAMDFGLAKSLKAQEDDLSRGIVGTPQYFSPEQARGEKADQRSDIYSLGIVLFEMLTGKKLFEAENAAGYIQKHIYEIPSSTSAINPLVPSFLEEIVLKSLEKDKEKRYQNVEEILKDLEEHEGESSILIPRPKVKKLMKFAYFIPLVLIIALGIYLLISRKEPGIPSLSEGERIPLVVMYFENNTGDINLEHWRKAISTLIINDLLQSKYIRVLTGDRLFDILKQQNLEEVKSYTSEDFGKVASQGGVRYILQGNFARSGDSFRINAMLHDAITGEFIGSERVEGKGVESFFSMVDQLTPWIKSMFNLTQYEIAGDIDREVGEITTNSVEALFQFIEGMKFYNEHKFEEGLEYLENAVAIDPDFAMAYRMIASSYSYMDHPEKVKKYYMKALEKMNHVSERERYLIKGAYFNSLEKFEDAIKSYKELLTLYPDDEMGNISLGAIYRNLEEWDLAVDQFEKVLKSNKRSSIAIENLTYLFMAKGWYDKAREILQANQNVFSNKAIFHWFMAHINLCQSRYDLALNEIEKAILIEPENYGHTFLKGEIYQSKSSFQESEKAYLELIEKKDSWAQSVGRYWLGQLYLMQGKYKKCEYEIVQGIKNSQETGRKERETFFLLFLAYLNFQKNKFKEALNVSKQAVVVAFETNSTDDQKSVLHFLGLAYLNLNEIEEAMKIAEQLKLLIEKTGNRKHNRLYYHLMGMIALHNNKLSESIEFFKKAYSLLSFQIYTLRDQAFYIEALAIAFYKNGDTDMARKYYEDIGSLTIARLEWGDIFVRSFYKLGKICQEKGWKEMALDYYEKYLQLCKNTDSSKPEKVDAQQQLIELKKETQE